MGRGDRGVAVPMGRETRRPWPLLALLLGSGACGGVTRPRGRVCPTSLLSVGLGRSSAA